MSGTTWRRFGEPHQNTASSDMTVRLDATMAHCMACPVKDP